MTYSARGPVVAITAFGSLLFAAPAQAAWNYHIAGRSGRTDAVLEIVATFDGTMPVPLDLPAAARPYVRTLAGVDDTGTRHFDKLAGPVRLGACEKKPCTVQKQPLLRYEFAFAKQMPAIPCI